MPTDVMISSFSPDSGPAGTTISIDVSEGVPDAHPNKLVVQGGMFTSRETGRRYMATDVQILDPQEYRRFAITVPPEIDEIGDYEFFIMLTDLEMPGYAVRLIATTPFNIPESGGGGQIFISVVIPKQITRTEMASTPLRITGRNLDQVAQGQGYFVLRPIMRRFITVSLSPMRAMIRMPNARAVPPGENYRIYAQTQQGQSANSVALTIT